MHPEYMILLRVSKINNMKGKNPRIHTESVIFMNIRQENKCKERRINIFVDPKLTWNQQKKKNEAEHLFRTREKQNVTECEWKRNNRSKFWMLNFEFG